jgi:hypothetical protein
VATVPSQTIRPSWARKASQSGIVSTGFAGASTQTISADGGACALLTTVADANYLHAPTNVMSNDILGCTVIYDEQQVFYDMGVHLQGSERGRNDSSRVGFTLEFHPDELFRGVHGAITMDKSGGYSGRGGKHDEIVLKQMINHAGGIPGMYDDLIHTLTPRASENGTGLLIMAKYGDVYLDSQYKNGGDGNLFKLELIYFPLSTLDGTPQGLKLPQPDDVLGTDFQDLGNNKESYRWTFLNENNHTRDDYSQMMVVAKTFSFSGAALDDISKQTLDVDEWMRTFAFESIGGIADTYGVSLPHNIMVYIRPEDLKGMAFPWDMDFAYYNAVNSGLFPGANLSKLVNLPANQRLFMGHLLDLITTTCNSTYVSRWANHYGSLLGQNWSGAVTIKVDHQLIRTGPYAWVRHPIYSGFLLAMLGTALTRGELRGLIGIALLWPAFSVKRRMEESFMRKTFGQEYDSYTQSTGALIPRLRPQSLG